MILNFKNSTHEEKLGNKNTYIVKKLGLICQHNHDSEHTNTDIHTFGNVINMH